MTTKSTTVVPLGAKAEVDAMDSEDHKPIPLANFRNAGEIGSKLMPLPGDHRRPPVKLKLERVNCDFGRPCPPDDVQAQEWGRRLKQAFATVSPDFIDASLSQLIMAARLPGGGLSETAVNAALAFIEGAKPRDEVEAALVIQMAATHSATMAVIRRIGSGGGGDRSLAVVASAASRLLRAYATQVETLRRLRNGGSQFVRVEHVHVAEGAQAVVGLVTAGGSPPPALAPVVARKVE
jgi:hypothetical protein